MKTKEEHINYWLEQANDDWEAVNTLLNGRKYLQALFFAHPVIEKYCKAVWVKNNEKNIQPKTHNLIFILSQTPVKLTDQQSEFLLTLNRFQLEGRYPEYITKIRSLCDENFTKEIINKTNEMRKWLAKKLQ